MLQSFLVPGRLEDATIERMGSLGQSCHRVVAATNLVALANSYLGNVIDEVRRQKILRQMGL
jgi:hypothetical protein